MYYSPTKVESELYGQDRRKKFVCSFQHTNKTKQLFMDYSPPEVESRCDGKDRIEFGELFQSNILTAC